VCAGKMMIYAIDDNVKRKNQQNVYFVFCIKVSYIYIVTTKNTLTYKQNVDKVN